MRLLEEYYWWLVYLDWWPLGDQAGRFPAILASRELQLAEPECAPRKCEASLAQRQGGVIACVGELRLDTSPPAARALIDLAVMTFHLQCRAPLTFR
jgi:hypothetical protein